MEQHSIKRNEMFMIIVETGNKLIQFQDKFDLPKLLSAGCKKCKKEKNIITARLPSIGFNSIACKYIL
jgi:hypothetical protein